MGHRSLLQPLLAAPAVLLTGCLESHVTSTFYLEPSGQVSWSILETLVRSDRDDLDEEGRYLDAVRAGGGPVAEGLIALAPLEVEVQALRDERPFTVLSRARYDRIDLLWTRLLEVAGAGGLACLEQDGARTAFTIEMVPCEGEDTGDDRLWALVDALASYRVTLTAGRFLEVEGFQLTDGDRTAVFEDHQGQESRYERPLRLRLVWTRAPRAAP